MKRSKESHLSSDVVRMGQLMRHIRLRRNIPERDILKDMGLTHASYWAMENGLQRQSFADLMRFATATQTCVITNMIASLSGDQDLALHGADNHIGAWILQLIVNAHAKAGPKLADLDLDDLETQFIAAIEAQLEAQRAESTFAAGTTPTTPPLRVIKS